MNLRRLGHTFFLAGTALVLAACSDGLDPELGLVNGFVHDTPGVSGAFTGTASGDFQLSIRLTEGPWVEVGSPNGITVDLQSTTPTTIHGSTSVPAGSYDRVRLTLSRVTFSVDAGGTIESTTLGAEASALAAGDLPLAIEISRSFTVSTDGGTATVSFDLNVEDWLTNQMLSDGVIADGDLTGQFTASVTSG